METGSLDLADYRRLFSVLETAAEAVEQEYFFDQIRYALARHLRWTDTLIVDIPASTEPFPAPSELLGHSHSDRPTCFTLEYAERWHLANPFKTRQAWKLLETEGLASVADLRAQRGSPQWAFVEQYLRRHRIAEVLNGLIDAGPAGKALSCVYFPDSSDLGMRERILLRKLQRQLTPWVAAHFTAAAASPWCPVLTQRERVVVDLAAQGMTNRQIASRLGITVDTIKKHLTHAMTKTGCASRTQLAVWWHGASQVSFGPGRIR